VRATHTVNQLLALARAESSGKTLPRQHCDLARITQDVVRDLVPRAMDRRIDLGYDGAQPGADGAAVVGNATLLKEMIRNLLDNAINYTPSTASQPGVITARVLADPIGRVVLLQVDDSGPGIPEAERELVFQPFYRSLETTSTAPGWAAIVLEIARQHEAEVRLEDAHAGQSPPGTRAVVRFTSAVAPQRQGAAVQEA